MGTNHYDRRHLYSDDVLVNCYLKYKSQCKAAEELGVSRETVARAVRRSGIALNGQRDNGQVQPGRKITDEQLKVATLEGKTCREIAIDYDMSEERVYRRAKCLGLEIDTQGTGGHWKRRAKRYGCREFDKSITLNAVITKYDGICQICGGRVDSTDIVNGHIGRNYPTVDHIVPLSKGGTHTWDNIQLAHMACNAGKCNKLDYTVKREEVRT